MLKSYSDLEYSFQPVKSYEKMNSAGVSTHTCEISTSKFSKLHTASMTSADTRNFLSTTS